MTILFSLFYSTLFFIPLCALIGPNGTFGDIIKLGHSTTVKSNEIAPHSVTESKNYQLPEVDDSKDYKLPPKASV